MTARTTPGARKPPGWLEGLLRNGELAKLAAQCNDQRELIAILEITEGAYQSARKKVRQAGRSFPSFEELQNRPLVAAGNENRSHDEDFADEAPTNPFDMSDVHVDAAARLHVEDAPHLPLLPPGHRYGGVSTLLDADGKIRAQWQKTTVSKEQYREALLQAVAEIAEPFRGMLDPLPAPANSDADLLAIYTVGDAHLGLMAHADETGANHDLATGKRDLLAAVDHLVSVAPPASSAVVLSLGDLVHFDNEAGTTTKGTRIDADTRWYKVMRTTIDTMRQCIDRALEKHAEVRAIFIRGNHDRHASAAVAMALACAYERDPRVTIDQSADPYSWIRFGKNLIGANHSDENSKPEALAGVMACDRAADWGECPYRYMLCGHLHHTFAKEEMGVLVERFPTLAPKDAWHHGKGYRAQQSMCVDTYHREWGRVNRSTVGIRQLRAA